MSTHKISFAFMAILFSISVCGAVTIEEARSKSKWGNNPGIFKSIRQTDQLSSYRASAAETAVFMNKLTAIESLLAKHPSMINPRGYNAYGTIRVTEQEDDATLSMKTAVPLTGNYVLRVHEFGTGPGGKAAESRIGYPTMVIRLNDFSNLFDGMRIYTSGFGSDIYYAPRKTGSYRGHTRYNENNDILLMTSSSAPLWIPVSAEEFITILIRRTEAARDEDMKELNSKDLSPQDIYRKGKAERLKAFNEAYAMLKKMNPAEAEKAKKEFEENEKRYAEEAATHRESSDELRATQKKLYDDRIAALRAELASLTPAQKKAQAVFAGESEEHPSGLGSPGDENARPVVRVNRSYFNDGRSRTAVRCITVKYNIHGQNSPEKFDWTHENSSVEAAVIINLYSTIDWKSIESLLDR